MNKDKILYKEAVELMTYWRTQAEARVTNEEMIEKIDEYVSQRWCEMPTSAEVELSLLKSWLSKEDK